MSNRTRIAMLAVASLFTSASLLPAAKYNKVVEIGDKAASFVGLAGVDGKQYGLTDFADAKGVVIVFMCNQCPVAMAYQERLTKLASEYQDKGLAVIAINVSKDEDLDAMRQQSIEAGFTFPYVHDETQESARQYGAVATPHVFLLDANRTIAYMGAIDDNWGKADEVKQPYLRLAVEAVLAGETPSITESKPVGCAIRWAN